jgi:UDP-N-acetylglucosamine 2-epimerase (non-hydrolysing)
MTAPREGRPTVAVVVGTRPEAIKLAPLVWALRRRARLRPLLVSTGQHGLMLDQALGVFDLEPDLDLEVMRADQALTGLTARVLEGLAGALEARRPACVVVQGDTTTALAAALAGFYGRRPVAHVEAGLRSGDRLAPFPEEVNRRLVDQLSDLHFAPTAPARDQLLQEGFPAGRVHLTGNTVVDALLMAKERVRRSGLAVPGLPAQALRDHRLLLVTAHRRESFGPALESVCRAVLRLVAAHPDTVVVYPVHMNPSVDRPVRRLLGDHPRVVLLPPVPYLEFVALMDGAHLILTDSGGVQEEAPALRKPVLVLREVTERPEGVEAGVARLVGTSEDRIVEEASRLLSDPRQYAAMASGQNPYGDGAAADRIALVLEREFGVGAPDDPRPASLPAA